jgi:small GTP-binding protein
MLERVLTTDQEQILADERQGLRALEQALTRAGASREDLDSLGQSLVQLDQLFLLVVVGEFNSGKSTLINALLGQPLLEEGVTPTTKRIHGLTWGEETVRETDADGIEHIHAPVGILKQIRIVDTPGTNALDRDHEALTQSFVPRSDLVVFVTSADRPLTESERAFIESIREWGKKLVLVINKIDFLSDEEDRRQVEEFVRTSCEQLLGFTPEIFPVSAKKALAQKLATREPTPAADGRFSALEEFLTRTLDERERVRLKLLNPLGVGMRLSESYTGTVESRLELLSEDLRTLDEIDRQLALFGDDLRSEFRFRLTDVDNELHEFEKRGSEFFDDTLRLARAMDLFNKERIQAEYERKVIADTPRRLEDKVDGIIDWMIGAELRQWQSTMNLLHNRKTLEEEGFRGALGEFDRNRQELLDSVGRVAQRSLADFDQRAEARRLAESVQTAVAGAALLEVGAVSLGTLFTLLASTQVADFTGIIAAGTLAIVGLFVLPARRRKAKADLSRKILRLRTTLLDTLTDEFDRETARSVHNIQESMAPYSRFVRSRQSDLETLRGEIAGLAGTLAALRSRIEAL